MVSNSNRAGGENGFSSCVPPGESTWTRSEKRTLERLGGFAGLKRLRLAEKAQIKSEKETKKTYMYLVRNSLRVENDGAKTKQCALLSRRNGPFLVPAAPL